MLLLAVVTLTACIPPWEAPIRPEERPETAPTERPAEGFRDWLAPSSNIKVGRFRYVSACHLLDDDLVLATMGDYRTASNWIEESFYGNDPKRPYATQEWSIRTSCAWNDGLADDRSLVLELSQGAEDDAATNRDHLVDLGHDADEFPELMQRWEDANLSQVEDSTQAEELLEELQDGVDAVTKAERRFDTKGDALASIVVPAEGLYGTNFAFVGTDGNVRFRLEAYNWETTGGSTADGDLLAAAATLIATIRERLADPGLSQSPAPTVRGYSDVLEETPILEPCAAFDRGVFESSTGLPQTAPVERRTPPFDLTVRDEHDRFEPTAACTRSYSAGLRPDRRLEDEAAELGPTGSLELTLRMVYFASDEEADDHYAEVARGRHLETAADDAQVKGGTATVVGRVGPYVLTLETLASASTGQYGDTADVRVSDEVLSDAFEQIVANVRRQWADAAG